jgi:hypothetical protein
MKSNETTGLKTNVLVSLDIVVKYKQARFNEKRNLGNRRVWSVGI